MNIPMIMVTNVPRRLVDWGLAFGFIKTVISMAWKTWVRRELHLVLSMGWIAWRL